MQVHRRLLVLLTLGLSAFGQNAGPVPDRSGSNVTTPVEVRTTFHVRYVSGNSVYVDGGRNAGLAEGMR